MAETETRKEAHDRQRAEFESMNNHEKAMHLFNIPYSDRPELVMMKAQFFATLAVRDELIYIAELQLAIQQDIRNG